MADQTELNARPTDKVGRVLYKIARVLAIIGGLILCAIAAMTTISITGRATYLGPIPGDFEIIAIGTGVVVFAFMPYCQLMRGNVLVDFFMEKAPTRLKVTCDIIGGILYFSVGFMLTWRMIYGGIGMYEYGENSMTIGFPRWTTFPTSVLCLTFLLVVTIYTIGRSIAEFKANKYFNE